MKTPLLVRNRFNSILLAAWIGLPITGVAALQFTNAMRLPDGQLQVQLITEVGQSYTIEISPNLTDWVPVATFPAVTTNLLTLIDPEPIAASVARFYRARLGADVSFELVFHHYARPGTFGSGLTPVISYPVSVAGFSAVLYVSGDTDYSEASEVFFSGPSGSGLAHSAANPGNTWIDESETTYHSVVVTNPPVGTGGEWTIEYKGTNRTFNLPDPQATARLVVPVPTVLLSGSTVTSVSWTYRDPATGASLNEPPAYMTGTQLQIEGLVGGRIYNSPWNEDPTVTTHVLSSSVEWNNVVSVALAYDDDLGNHYVIFFQKL
jgi:hypothetical protein